MPEPTIIALAGSSGDLGTRISRALLSRGATVRALVRTNADTAERRRLEDMGLQIARADPSDVSSMAEACEGASCVVSALNGVRDVIVGRQRVLLQAAVQAGVPRFMPSDFAADFTKTRPGDNRNFDFRREFMSLADAAPIQVTSILNGAFMDMLGREMPLIQSSIRRVLYWGDADQPLDFTTKDDVAAYTSCAAMDAQAPRLLRIAGDVLSARQLAAALSSIAKTRYRTLWAGNMFTLGAMIGVAKRVAPQPDVAFPPWQGMQYLRDQFSGLGKLTPLNNDRYPALTWTSVRTMLAEREA